MQNVVKQKGIMQNNTRQTISGTGKVESEEISKMGLGEMEHVLFSY